MWQLCPALEWSLLCSRLILHQTSTFCCHEQGSEKLQHGAEQELGSEQDIKNASCLFVQGSVEERIMEMIEQRKKGLQQGSSADRGVDEEGGAHRGMKRAARPAGRGRLAEE